jgi:hypothetical protein
MRLKYHLRNGAYSYKIKTICSYPVNAHIADEQHTVLSFTLRLGSKQPSQKRNIAFSGFHNSHHLHLFHVL